MLDQDIDNNMQRERFGAAAKAITSEHQNHWVPVINMTHPLTKYESFNETS